MATLLDGGKLYPNKIFPEILRAAPSDLSRGLGGVPVEVVDSLAPSLVQQYRTKNSDSLVQS